MRLHFLCCWEYIKIYFKEKNQADRVQHLILAWVEQEEVISDSAAAKSDFLFLSRTTIWLSVRIRGPNCKDRKNLSHQKGFVTRFMNGAP